MMADPIVEEVRRIREQIFAEHNYDMKAFFKHLMRLQEEGRKAGREYVSLPPRRPPGFQAQKKKSA